MKGISLTYQASCSICYIKNTNYKIWYCLTYNSIIIRCDDGLGHNCMDAQVGECIQMMACTLNETQLIQCQYTHAHLTNNWIVQEVSVLKRRGEFKLVTTENTESCDYSAVTKNCHVMYTHTHGQMNVCMCVHTCICLCVCASVPRRSDAAVVLCLQVMAEGWTARWRKPKMTSPLHYRDRCYGAADSPWQQNYSGFSFLGSEAEGWALHKRYGLLW